MDPLVIFTMSTKRHKSSMRMIIHWFVVLKTCFLKFDHDLNDRVSLCINIFCNKGCQMHLFTRNEVGKSCTARIGILFCDQRA